MILVTGGAGYIGSHFVAKYLAKFPNEHVVVIDNLSEGHKEALLDKERISFHQEDVGNVPAVREILKKHRVDAVVHFASSCYVGESQANPSKYFRNNVINGLSLMEAMEAEGARRFVLSSSCATYGNPQYVPLDERHPQNPINIYGLTKLLLERTLAGYASTKNWSYVSLRYFNAAGADDKGRIGEDHDPETHIIPLALQTAMGQRPVLEIFGDDYDTPDGTCIRDYIHVNDLSTAHWQALDLTSGSVIAEHINLGTAHGASVKEIVDLCEKVSNRKINVKVAPRRSGDPPRLVANNEKAAKVLGWEPEYNLERIIRTAWQWEQNKQSQPHLSSPAQ